MSRAFDACLAAVAAAVGTAGAVAAVHAPWPVVVLAIAGNLLLVVRRQWPLPVLVGVTAVTAVVWVAAGDPRPMALGCLIAVYTVAARTTRGIGLVAAAVTAVAAGVASNLATDASVFDARNVVPIIWIGLVAAAGVAVRNRRAYVAAVEERARRAEETREQEARRRVAEERLRIARELHDVVAHSIALVNVQAGVAAHLLREQPDAAEEALDHVRAASRSVLDELGTMLSVLRESDDPVAPSEPAPGLDRLDDLVETFRATGMRVDVRLTGAMQPVSTTASLAAYRIVQESLTNARKHGAEDRATVAVTFDEAAATISVRNPVGGPATEGTGHGILGMRERAAAVGGRLTAQQRGDDFVVDATLPYPK
ncbi:sensor histidine kinase [Cryptosporangium phraense]|uniref:histidine kinase n=1 Tax=Cryptosporangium phraense TaxID=2593070 RepID=A0A545AP16_9ACTN|nr:sensor histidine kinase [Cryptosporangium phraense]TQS43072.1 sensor histidine kinase [Cryptosporangium phraense]